MTTLLPTQDLATLRAIARTSAVLLVCLRIDQLHPGRAIADFEIADILEQDPRTVKRQLRSLSAAGLLLEQGFRWVVTAQGRNTLFGQRQSQVREEPALIEEAEVVCEGGDNVAQNVQVCDCAHDVAQNVPQLIEEEEDNNILTDSDSSSSSSERTFCASTEQILLATSVLFGSAVTMTPEILSRDPVHALCWVSKAWGDRATRDNPKGLTKPQGLIFRRLAGRARPPVYLLREPTQGLPNAYLAEIGLAVREEEAGTICWRCMRMPCVCEEDE